LIYFSLTKNLWNFVDERLKYSMSITAELVPSSASHMKIHVSEDKYKEFMNN
jgi:hypothetical protein